MFAKAALILSLVPGLLASSQVPALGGARTASSPVHGVRAPAAALRTTAKRPVRRHSAAARATERKLLLLAPRKKLLRRFVDGTTGLVKRNVTAHCRRYHGKPALRYLHRFLCRVWVQPRLPSSGVAVVCRTGRHHVFHVTAYHRRHRPHKGR